MYTAIIIIGTLSVALLCTAVCFLEAERREGYDVRKREYVLPIIMLIIGFGIIITISCSLEKRAIAYDKLQVEKALNIENIE